jgi:hypothetical protein
MGLGKNGSASAEVLVPSLPDVIRLAHAIEERFMGLSAFYFRTKGTPLALPEPVKKDAITWRRLLLRYGQGDFRNTRSELKAMRMFAQWTVDVNCEIRNQPKQTINWSR